MDQTLRSVKRSPSAMASIEAPYRLIGLQVLSVDRAMAFLTPQFKAACVTFSAPRTLVRMHSNGLYSAVGTCLRAAA